MTSKYKQIQHSENSANDFCSIRWCGSQSNLFACDLDNSRHDTLEAAIERRDYLESDAGKQEILQRNERRRIQREFDIARAARKEQESIERQWKRVDQGYYEGEVQFA